MRKCGEKYHNDVSSSEDKLKTKGVCAGKSIPKMYSQVRINNCQKGCVHGNVLDRLGAQENFGSNGGNVRETGRENCFVKVR